MDIILTLKIEHQEDLTLVEQLAQKRRIKYHIKEKKVKKPTLVTSQLQVFNQMEDLRKKLQAIPVPVEIDIAQLANEVNAI